MEKDWENASTTDKDGLLKICNINSYFDTGLSGLSLGVVVVPELVVGKDVVDLLDLEFSVKVIWLGDLWCDKERVTEHELRSDIPHDLLIWELVPHGSHQGLSGAS